MWLRDWWDRLRGYGPEEEEFEEEDWLDDGGVRAVEELDDVPAPDAVGIDHVRPALDELRWYANNETASAAQMEIDPASWRDGDIRLETERFLAHSHEALRSELASHVGELLRDGAQRLHPLATWIGTLRDQLTRVDKRLVEATSDHDRMYRALSRNPTELGRYHRLRSDRAKAVKLVIGLVFILTELFLSGRLFESALGADVRGLGYVVALGLMLLLIFIPHYAAAGLREGMTRYHEHRSYGPPEPGPNEQALHMHMEEAEDRGFRIVATTLLVTLGALIVPLSWLRASEAPDEELFWPLFALYAFVQVGISGYFFLREWFDHSAVGQDLEVLARHVEELDARREALLDEYEGALSEFHEEAEEVLFYAGQVPHWDTYLVEQYHATLSGFRAGLSARQPDLAPFLAYSTKPGLDTATAPSDAARQLDPLSHENPTLGSPGPRGRQWWVDSLVASVAHLPEAEAGMYTGPGWLYTKAPFELLEDFLKRFHGLDITYVAPRGLTEPAVPSLPQLLDGPREEAASTGHHDHGEEGV